jgi:hypothetical protein
MSTKTKRHTPEQVVRKRTEAGRLLADAELEKDALREIAEGTF